MIRFLNNFRSALTDDFTEPFRGYATIAPADAARLAAVLDNNNHIHQIALTLFDNAGAIEIVYCDEADADTGSINVHRNQQGTSGPATWPAGTLVEARLTAGVLAELPGLTAACILTGASGDVLTGADGNVLVTDAHPTFFGNDWIPY